MKLVIVGGVAGGATAAARARRLAEDAEITVFERGVDVSFANCGLPYFIGGEIGNRAALVVQSKSALEKRFALDIRTESEVVRIDRTAKVIEVRHLPTGRQYTENYDKLLLSPGAKPVVPPLSGVDLPQVFTLRNLSDMDKIHAEVKAGAKEALVVGGGFIGLEMAENLRRRGLKVAVVELLPQVMPPLDPEVAQAVQLELQANGVDLHLGVRADSFAAAESRVRAKLSDGTAMDVDLVLLAAGVAPDSGLAREAGLTLNSRGAIVVDDEMKTSDPDIYAVGDAVEVRDPVSGSPAFVPLAGPANRQARIAVDSIFGLSARHRGTLGTSIVRIFGVTAASTGASEKSLKQRGIDYRKVYVHRGSHAGYFPGAQQMMIKLLFDPQQGALLGAQIVGGKGVDKRIDVLATALSAGLTVFDLEHLELAYAPQFGSAKDPVNIAGNVAVNLLNGAEQFVYAEDLGPDKRKDWTVLDVREESEYQAGHISGAVHLPLGKLRSDWQSIEPQKPIAVYCGVGQRAYYATRILRHHGLNAFNLAGGLTTYRLVHAEDQRTARTEAAPPGSSKGSEDSCQRTKDCGKAEGREVDLRGLQCPGPINRLAEEAKRATPGTVLAIRASDPGFASDLRGWAERQNHRLIEIRQDSGEIAAQLEISKEQSLPVANEMNRTKTRFDGPQDKTMVVFSGDLDRVLAAFIIANSAADMGDRVTMFFTFWGLNALRNGKAPARRKPFLDRMFSLMMPNGARRLKLSKMNFFGPGTMLMNKVMRDKRVPELSWLIDSAVQKGVRLVACSMSMNVMGIDADELIAGVEFSGAAGYLSAASQGNVNLFI